MSQGRGADGGALSGQRCYINYYHYVEITKDLKESMIISYQLWNINKKKK